MKIAFVSPEVYPFAKTGGLADVSRSLPMALAKNGHEVCIFMPGYKTIDRNKFGLELAYAPLPVSAGADTQWTALHKSGFIPGVITYFIDYEKYFGRDSLYDENGIEYPDNAERFSFFARAVIHGLKALDYHPDIIHCNDWQTGILPLYLKLFYAADPCYINTACVMTVHNAAYQGIFPESKLSFLELDTNNTAIKALKSAGSLNYLQAGILYSDVITTVSSKYAYEIQTEEYGYNLAVIFKKNSSRLFGIQNSIDHELWDPSTDKFLPAVFSAGSMEGKNRCKIELQKKFNLSEDINIPLFGLVSRLTYQKGIDFLADTMKFLIQDADFQFILMGAGDRRLFSRFEAIRNMFPDRTGLYYGYNEEMEHLIEAGLDVFLMPSRYEPCGLNQMYSFKYGTIPLVRATGGLDDTVIEWDEAKQEGNGFKFRKLETEEFYNSFRRLIWLKKNCESEWNNIQQNAMKFNYTWKDAAGKYEKIYSIARNNKSW